MCFIPISLLKGLVSVGAFVSCLLSLSLLALAIYANVEKKDIIDQTDKQIVNDLLIVMYIVSIFFLLLSMGGVYGAIKTKKKKNNNFAKCLLSSYFLGVIVFLIVFLVSTIVFFTVPGSVFSGSCQKGDKTQLVEQLYDLNVNATKDFCTQKCPCYISNQNMQSPLAKDLLSRGKLISNDTKTSYQNYQNCLNNSSEDVNALLMGSLEKLLNCGGWCSNQTYPRFNKFSNINQCTSKQCYIDRSACYDQFKGFMVDKGFLLGIGSVIATAICFINMIMICSLNYHPSNRKSKTSGLYSRMMADS